MSKLLGGSLCLTDINANARIGHSAFTKAANGKIYFNVNIWLNDEADKYGNTASVQLNSKKELRDQEGKIYIGNAKPVEAAQPEPLAAGDSGLPEDDDLPF
jgi:hypothetical protein